MRTGARGSAAGVEGCGRAGAAAGREIVAGGSVAERAVPAAIVGVLLLQVLPKGRMKRLGLAVLGFILVHRVARQQSSASWLASDVGPGTNALLRLGGWLLAGALVIGLFVVRRRRTRCSWAWVCLVTCSVLSVRQEVLRCQLRGLAFEMPGPVNCDTGHTGRIPRSRSHSKRKGIKLTGGEYSMTTFHVAALWRYPVKTLAGEELTTAEIGPEGIAGDRKVWVCGPEAVRTSRRHHRLLGSPRDCGGTGAACCG